MGTDGKFPFFWNHQSVFAQRDTSDKYQKRPVCPLGLYLTSLIQRFGLYSKRQRGYVEWNGLKSTGQLL
jgi:hypothetical protein